MPLHITKQDVTQLGCDTIVTTPNATPFEEASFETFYTNALTLAKDSGFESVAIPLISLDGCDDPTDKALSIAVKTISEFLLDSDMTVYIAVPDEESYPVSNDELFNDVAEYISERYEDARNRDCVCYSRKLSDFFFESEPSCCREESIPGEIVSLENMLSKMDDTFAVTLLKLIDVKGITDVECYKKANVSKQTWYKIMNEKNYKPSKNTVIAFAIALELTLEETKHLLSTVGFTLSKSNKFDIIIEYFLINEEYNIFTINETLFKFDQVCLGV